MARADRSHRKMMSFLDGAGNLAPDTAAGAPGDPGVLAGDSMSVADWLHGEPNAWMLQDLLRGVIDPEVGVDIVNLGLVYGLDVTSDGVADIRMTLTTPGCPLSGYMDDAVHDVLWGAPGINSVNLQIVWDPPWDTDMMSEQAKRDLGWIR